MSQFQCANGFVVSHHSGDTLNTVVKRMGATHPSLLEVINENSYDFSNLLFEDADYENNENENEGKDEHGDNVVNEASDEVISAENNKRNSVSFCACDVRLCYWVSVCVRVCVSFFFIIFIYNIFFY